MNEYTFFRDGDGFIESNIPHFVDTYSAIFQAQELAAGYSRRMSILGFDDTPPPSYPYLKAASAHSAAVQLYARSGQLATADVLYTRGKAQDNLCPLGCKVTGSMHHLFLHCTNYDEWRLQAGVDLVSETKKKLHALLSEEECALIEGELIQLAESIFSTDSSGCQWPLQMNVYYLGKHPSLSRIISDDKIQSAILRRRTISHISSDWHSRCIRLAGRIFGDYQKRMAAINGCRKRTT
jgi:hypothetical protein